MADKYNFQYLPVTGKLAGKDMLDQTERAINELAEIVNEGSAQVEVLTKLANDANNNAAEALEKATEALETSSRIYITESSAVDLDDYCESQLIYIADDTSDNLPVEDTGFLEVKTNDDKTACDQVFVCDTTADTYTRSGTITAETVGDVTTYTASFGAWTSKPATENYVQNELQSYAPLNSPAFTGNPTATTQTLTDDSTKIATTEFVHDNTDNKLPLAGGTMTGAIKGNPITLTADDGNGNTASFVANADGTLEWDGKSVERVNSYDKTNTSAYIRFENGLQICWGRMSNISTTASTINFAVAFIDTPRVATSQNVTNTSISAYDFTTTGFTVKAGSSSGNGGSYIALGYWK